MDRKTLGTISAVVIIITLAIGIPYGIKTYKLRVAKGAIELTTGLRDAFQQKLAETQKSVTDSLCLTPEEKHQLEEKLCAAENRLTSFSVAMKSAETSFASSEYDKTREALQVLQAEITTELGHVKVLSDFCAKVAGLRDRVLKNELYLKARLKKPYPFSEKEIELPAELAMLPKEYLQYVPRLDAHLEEGMRTQELGPELNNSLGANLVKLRPVLDHILTTAKREPIKERARELFARAIKYYRLVRAKNDALPIWYRASHDGTLTAERIELLDKQQSEVVGIITAGDQALKDLIAYDQLLHSQTCVYISGHAYRKKEFSHTGTRPSLNSKGELTLKNYKYTTDGREFFIIQRTATTEGMTEGQIRVGEIDDPVAMWTFGPTQEVGYVEHWKPLHDDQVYVGTLESLKPVIEEEFPHLANDPFEKK